MIVKSQILVTLNLLRKIPFLREVFLTRANNIPLMASYGFRSICTQLTQLSLTINELKNTILLEKNISRKICTDLQFTEKYGMEFPCKTLADFMQFEEKLKSDAKFQQDFVRYFYKYT